MKKFWLLFVLLIGPLLFYLLVLLVKIEANFLPVINKNVIDIATLAPNQEVIFKNHINIIGFLGDDLLNKKTNALNLNEKIYKRYYKFKTFQFVMLIPIGNEEKVNELKNELGFTTDIVNWKFVFTTKEKINAIHQSLLTTKSLNKNAYTGQVFIVDKDGFQRGRTDHGKNKDENLYSYNSESVSFIHKIMIDDIKIVLEEYRRALKKNKKEDVFNNPYNKKKKLKFS